MISMSSRCPTVTTPPTTTASPTASMPTMLTWTNGRQLPTLVENCKAVPIVGETTISPSTASVLASTEWYSTPTTEIQVTPASGNVLDNDDYGHEGGMVSAVNGNVVKAGTLIDGEYGALQISANGEWTYTPFTDLANVGAQEIFSYTLTQPDGDNSIAELVISLTDGDQPEAFSLEFGSDSGEKLFAFSAANFNSFDSSFNSPEYDIQISSENGWEEDGNDGNNDGAQRHFRQSSHEFSDLPDFGGTSPETGWAHVETALRRLSGPDGNREFWKDARNGATPSGWGIPADSNPSAARVYDPLSIASSSAAKLKTFSGINEGFSHLGNG